MTEPVTFANSGGAWKYARVPLICIGVVFAVVVGFIALVAATHGPAKSDPSNAIATAQVDGRDIAVVVYKNDTFGHLDLFRVESMGFSTQAEAFDLDTGERVWDTLLFAEFGGTAAQVLGMGSQYVYVSTAKGLVILDAATGEIIAREGAIPGLGDDYIASMNAYVWDVESQSVVLLSASGGVLSIPVDAVEATRAPADAAARWVDELGTGTEPGSVFSPDAWEQTDGWVPFADGSSVFPEWAADGWSIDVLLEDGTGLAAGSAEGFAVTQTYEPSTSDAAYLFQVGDIESGRLIGTAEGSTSASAVTISEGGHVAFLSNGDDDRALLVVASADGIRTSVIGERGFLGW